MERKIMNELKKWKFDAYKKPILVDWMDVCIYSFFFGFKQQNYS